MNSQHLLRARRVNLLARSPRSSFVSRNSLRVRLLRRHWVCLQGAIFAVLVFDDIIRIDIRAPSKDGAYRTNDRLEAEGVHVRDSVGPLRAQTGAGARAVDVHRRSVGSLEVDEETGDEDVRDPETQTYEASIVNV